MIKIAIASSLAVVAPALGVAITSDEIVAQLDDNQTHSTSIVEGSISVQDRFGSRVSNFISWARGADRSLTEFTSAAEAGQKILRLSGEIYLYYPDAAETIRLRGAALRDSLLGSDVSYEDITGNRGLIDSYRTRLVGEETIDGNDCYVVELTAKIRDIAYPRQKLWIDKELFTLRRSEQYALSGTLLKVVDVEDTITIDGKTFASETIIRDQLKSDSMTRFIIDSIRVDADLPRGIFSLEELSF